MIPVIEKPFFMIANEDRWRMFDTREQAAKAFARARWHYVELWEVRGYTDERGEAQTAVKVLDWR